MNEPTAMLIDQVPAHLLAGVKGPRQRGRNGALFCYGVENDVLGPAQNGTGPCGVLSFDRETFSHPLWRKEEPFWTREQSVARDAVAATVDPAAEIRFVDLHQYRRYPHRAFTWLAGGG